MNFKQTYNNTIYIICFIVLFTLINSLNISKTIVSIIIFIFIIILFKLDLKYSLRIEKGSDTNLRINTEKFIKNYSVELCRYIEDTNYYNNTWRISMSGSLIISLFILPCIQNEYIKYLPHIIIGLFCIIYHTWKWKLHHSHDFIFKSLIHALKHTKDKTFKSIVHC